MPVLCLLLLIGIVGILLKRNPGGTDALDTGSYEKKTAVFTPAERSFLGVLDQALGVDYRVFGKVSLADLFQVKKGLDKKKRAGAFNRIQSKHVDFVVCKASDLMPILLIELDDKSHQTARATRKDRFLNEITTATDTALLRITAKSNYSQQEIIQQMTPHLRRPGDEVINGSAQSRHT